MKSSITKLTGRSIRSFFGRYLALLMIIALSVGLFAGLKITKPAMAHTAGKYFDEQNFYDFQIISVAGFGGSDVETFGSIEGVSRAEGSRELDALIETGDTIAAYKLIAMPSYINVPSVVSGRMPEAANECVVDDEAFTEEDIGTVLTVSPDNSDTVAYGLTETEYTIVGLVNSPLYLNDDRGTTMLSGGAPAGFIYIMEECFAGDVYTSIYVTVDEKEEVYSDEYDELIDLYEPEITDAAETITDKYYVLTRDENAGYLSFEGDTSIISGIANIFPVFFVLISMMVCITTMGRMVEEERTQIGVLKAMGFSDGAVMWKYMLYALSATAIGWAAGFFLGTWGLPAIFWWAYGSLYDFAKISYVFSPLLAFETLAVALIGITGSTLIACSREFRSVPARLIRPRTAKKGKRIFLEKISFIWKRLSFLHKVSIRNMFRYKQRLVMLLLGVSCCAALVVTAFGIRDSMIDLGELQYEEIQQYDLEVSYIAGYEDRVQSAIDGLPGENHTLAASTERVRLTGGETMRSVQMLRFDTEDVSGFWNFRNGEEELAFPEEGEALIGRKVAEKLDLNIGDTVEIQDSDFNAIQVEVSGIFDNYIDNYVVLSSATGADSLGQWESNTIYLSTNQDTHSVSEELMGISEVSGISFVEDSKESIDEAMECLDYIIWLLLIFSGALAFIVIYNLTNINLAERSREIATVQVLGFYPKETESYVLRENLILSLIAAVIGMPLGKLFHHVVMDKILIDNMYFPEKITFASYVISLICTVLFAIVVNLFMKRRVNKIPMAESLKAVE